ncbi:hypothetical protein F5148DRAFT_1154209 [Russula earlei]|uniref:Uncharacterized protein n=1 Tax=Russula earlei TaxID=71964 RepID=A0ACC0TSX1_9AGAM|nr:hypothetical protein F5148DRAFT_1154209 [Russula earlei]
MSTIPDALNQAKNSYVRCGWGSEAAERGTTTSGALTSEPDERCSRPGKTVKAVRWDAMVSGGLRCVRMMKGIQDWLRRWRDVDERSKENGGERQGRKGGGDERKDERDDMGVVGMKGGWRVMAKAMTESQHKRNGGWKAGHSASADRQEENDGNIIWDIDVDAPAFMWYEDHHFQSELHKVKLFENKRLAPGGKGVGWSKASLKMGERIVWTRGQDGCRAVTVAMAL